MKVCRVCGVELVVGENILEKTFKSSNYKCRPCAAEYHRRWREANLEKVREYDRRWCEANPEKQREYDRRWREANPEKIRERHMRWREANLEKQRESERRWREANRAQKIAVYLEYRRYREFLKILSEVNPKAAEVPA